MYTIKVIKADMYPGREIPFDIDVLLTMQPKQRPDTDMQALMEAAPGDQIEESKTELQILREAVVDCIDTLSEKDRFVIDAMNSERIRLEDLAERMNISVTHAWRLQQQAYGRLKEEMLKHPIIREYLGLDDE